MVQEIALCALQYKNNLCASSPIPAMAQQCGSWETCMQRDPTIIGRAKVGAELIAEVVNSFVEPISWKTLVMFSDWKSVLLLLISDPCVSIPDTISGVYPDIAVISNRFHQCASLPLSIEISRACFDCCSRTSVIPRRAHYALPRAPLWRISFSYSHADLGTFLGSHRRGTDANPKETAGRGWGREDTVDVGVSVFLILLYAVFYSDLDVTRKRGNMFTWIRSGRSYRNGGE